MAVSALRADCERAGIRLDATPVDARRGAEVPLQLTSPRYLAMQRHFDTIGPAGRTMMRRTASTQICLDWWSGRGRSGAVAAPQPGRPVAGCRLRAECRPESRLATWLAVDPSRTAFDDRLLHGDDPVAAYADFAAQASGVHRARGRAPSTSPPSSRRCGRAAPTSRCASSTSSPCGASMTWSAVFSTLLYDDDLSSRGDPPRRLREGRARRAVGACGGRRPGAVPTEVSELVALARAARRVGGAA